MDENSLTDYLKIYRPSKAERDAPAAGKKDFGSNPYGGELFGKMNPKHKIDIRVAESTKSQDDILLERWQRMAGLLQG